ncbi:MAG: bifunctional diaminohydroxyphosphoribosylaminopyrimidine deaminase/5-amino-6-(5-phosphoribosylamino)uracil reductase RibD [Pseudomonadota bacterium]
MFSKQDHSFMARALELGRLGCATSQPNPSVGCVLAKDGKIVGEGWHERAGEGHAEANALRSAGGAAKDATAYVTLEPCSHQGRTPPCSDALVEAGLKRVVFSVEDPSPKVSGDGAKRLIDAGIEVQSGLMEVEARELHRGFISRFERNRPWFLTKVAASLDGKTALANGVSQWITSAPARTYVHRLRSRSCAVLTGIDTVLLDDASLTVRHVDVTRQPSRVVLDTHLRLPLTAKMLGEPAPVLVFHSSDDVDKIAKLEELGSTLIKVAKSGNHLDIREVAKTLCHFEINDVMVEAGATLNAALLQNKLIDEFVFFMAPSLLGGSGRNMFALPEFESLSSRVNLNIDRVRQVGPDLLIRGGVAY